MNSKKYETECSVRVRVCMHVSASELVLVRVYVRMYVGGLRVTTPHNNASYTFHNAHAIFSSDKDRFAAHPVHVEAVTGIVGRADLLCSFFLLLAVHHSES